MMGSRWCKHYNGVANHAACEAGVAYKDVEAPAKGALRARWPCFGGSALPCAARVYPTPEECAEEEREFGTQMDRITKARAAIIAKHGKTRGAAGEIPCPNCAGTLRYSIASNGHVHAACSTAGCCAWME